MKNLDQYTARPGVIISVSLCLMISGCGSGGSSSGNSAGPGNGATPPPANALATCVEPGEQLPRLSGLPVVSSGQRPGPAWLYEPPPVSPILSNHDPRFVAAPILVQGQEAYVNGEYLYQDYIYDDYGSDVSNDDLNEIPVTVGNNDLNGLEPRVGDVDPPTNFARYGGNGADLVEFRVSHGVSDTAYRITLNTLLEEDAAIVAIVFDMDNDVSTGLPTLPRDPGAPFPGSDEVIFLWGSGAEHVRLGATGNIATPLPITTRLDANQMWVTVPRSLHNPTGEVSVTVAAGLYDTGNGGWLMPQTSDATASRPGVVKPALFDPNPAGIFNLAFRFDEPTAGQNTPPDTFQSEAIRQKNPNQYKHRISYDDLAAGTNRSSVPATGTQTRLYASEFSLNPDGSLSADNSGEGRDLILNDPSYFGPLQSYAIYIPSAAATSNQPLPMNWALHSNGQEHWQYNGTQYVQQIGEALDAYVPTTLGRGPRNWYDLQAEADFFEVWRDIVQHFNVDANRVAITGYSMGGFASYRFGTLYPDLFGRAFTQVGPPAELIWIPPNEPDSSWSTLSNLILGNVRNIPYLNLAMVMDELVPYTGPLQQNTSNPAFAQFNSFQELGYRYRFQTYPAGEHFTLFLLDNFPMGTDFLDGNQVDRNPRHVTFSYMPAEDEADFRLRHDHAYWVSELQLASLEDSPEGFPAIGTIDAFSHACGRGDPPTTPIATAGAIPLAYQETGLDWGPAPQIEVENRLTVGMTNLSSARLDVPRSGADTSQPLAVDITADGDGVLTLTGNFPAGSVITREGSAAGSVSQGQASLSYSAGTQTFRISRP